MQARLITGILAAALATLITEPAAHAATSRWWDGGTTDIAANGNSASDGGSGTWNATLLNWDAGASPHVAWNNANNDTAVFGGTAGTVTLGSGITVGGLRFDAGGYTLTGNTLTLGTGALITGSGNATIGSILAGSSGLTKDSTGLLSLSGANTYSGDTYANAGILDFGSISLSGFGGGRAAKPARPPASCL